MIGALRVKVHAQVSSGSRGLILGLNLHLLVYLVCGRSGGSGRTAAAFSRCLQYGKSFKISSACMYGSKLIEQSIWRQFNEVEICFVTPQDYYKMC